MTTMMVHKSKIFDAVEMVRDIRNAMYEQKTVPKFDPKKFVAVKTKWLQLLEEQQTAGAVKEPTPSYRVRPSSKNSKHAGKKN